MVLVVEYKMVNSRFGNKSVQKPNKSRFGNRISLITNQYLMDEYPGCVYSPPKCDTCYQALLGASGIKSSLRYHNLYYGFCSIACKLRWLKKMLPLKP